MTKRDERVRTNAPEEFHHEVDGGAPALLGSVVEVGLATVSSKSSFSSVSRDEENELVTKEGTFDFLEFLRRWLRPVKVLLEAHLLQILFTIKMRQNNPGAIEYFMEVVVVLLH